MDNEGIMKASVQKRHIDNLVIVESDVKSHN